MGKKQHRKASKCGWCNSKMLGEMPGYFRDVDVDGGTGKYGVCMNCGGTGIALPSHDQRRGLFYSYRFQRDSLTHIHRRLMREHLFGTALLQDRDHIIARIEKIVATLASFKEITENDTEDIRALALYFDVLLHEENVDYGEYFKKCILECSCRNQRSELLAFVNLIKSLPRRGTAAYDRLAEEMRQLKKGYVRDCMKTGLDDLVDTITMLQDDTLYEELSPTYKLRHLLVMSESIEALFTARDAVEDVSVQKGIIALQREHRDAIPHIALTSLWELYRTFLYGRPLFPTYQIEECSCQKMCGVFAAVHRKVFNLLSPIKSGEWIRKSTALAPLLVRISREMETIGKKAEDVLLFEEFLLLLLVREYWIECGRPQKCYAANLSKHLERDVLGVEN